MRLLVLTHNYPRFPGDPAGAYVARLARAAADAGNEVRVIAPHTPRTSEHEQEHGLTLRRFRYAPTTLERVGYRGASESLLLQPLTLALVPLYLSAFRRTARRAVTEFRPAVVHAHWWFPAGWVASALDVPYVVTSHGSDVRLFDRGGWWHRTGRRVLSRAAAVTAASRFLAGDLERHAGRLPHPVVVTPMPLDVAQFEAGRASPKAVPPRILFAGNLVPSKGVDVLIRALAVLKARAVPCRAKILGEGPAKAGLERLAALSGVGTEIEWSPFLPQDRMPAEYGASTIAVLPSRGQAEGLGLTLVEALLAGCAVVGTPAGGIPEVVRDGVTGLIALDGDAGDLAEKLARLLLDPDLRERLTQAGRRMALATYATDAAARRFLDLYDAVARDHQAH
jgi:glycosyltransferase involved in cell wall biosynthesis